MKEVIPEAIKEQVKEAKTAKEELDEAILYYIQSIPEYKTDKKFPKQLPSEDLKQYKEKVDQYLKDKVARKKSGIGFHSNKKYSSNYTPPKKRK